MLNKFTQMTRKWLYSKDPYQHWYLKLLLKIFHFLRRLITKPDPEIKKVHRAIKHIYFSDIEYPKVNYLHRDFPSALPTQKNIVRGGAVKYLKLNEVWPQAKKECNLLYGISSAHTDFASEIVRTTKERGIKLVWNQNGVWVPEAYPKEMVENGNQIMAHLLHSADYVFYQSQFCKRSADHFLGQRDTNYEILYNAVDTTHFTPPNLSFEKELILLISGSHNIPYRLPVAIHTLNCVIRKRSNTRLIIAGQVSDIQKIYQLINELKLENHIEFINAYNQEEAPNIYRRAHILLHTKYNDPCPTVVIEAMSCGLPVVYSKTGGLPELVNNESGFGVDSPSDWYVLHTPDPQKLAEGILQIAADLSSYSQAARERAVSLFDYQSWLKRHNEVFEKLVQS